MARDPHLFLLPLAFARRFQEAKHRLRHIRVTDEDALHRTGVLRIGRSREREIGGIEVHHVAAGVGHGQTVEGVVGDARDHGIVGRAIGEADDSGGESEQVEQPDHRQQRQQPEDIRLRLRPADGHQRDCHRDDPAGHQQHQNNAAAAPRRLVGREGLGGGIAVGFGGHIERCGPSASR